MQCSPDCITSQFNSLTWQEINNFSFMVIFLLVYQVAARTVKEAAAAHHTIHVMLCSFTHLPEMVTQNRSRAVCTDIPDFKPNWKHINTTAASSEHSEVNETKPNNDFIHKSAWYKETFLAESSCMSGRGVKGDTKFITSKWTKPSVQMKQLQD